jgi:formiminoglutamase
MEKAQIGNFCKGRPGAFRFSLAGFPDDLGVRNVNGRPGASQGPARFLEYFLKLRGLQPVQASLLTSTLCKMGADLDQNHSAGRELTERQVRELGIGGIKPGAKSPAKTGAAHLAVGGGHDWAWPWIQGFSAALGPKIRVGCLNIDAHFDLRPSEPVMTSGSPFRRLIEEKILSPARLVEFGIQNHCNSAELWEYARKQKIKTVPFDQLRNGRALKRFRNCLQELKKNSDVILISLDLDAASLAVAPGVSAPQPEGFSASEVYQMLELAAGEKKVLGLGIFELAPPLDVQDHTARFAAQCAWKFLSRKLETEGA